MKKIFIPTAVVFFLLCGCAAGGVSVSMTQKSYESTDEEVVLEIPVIKGLASRELENELNAFYENTAADYADELVRQAEERRSERSGSAVLEFKSRVPLCRKNILSIVNDIYVYTGGVNGVSSRIAKNIDTELSKELTLADAFIDGSYRDKLNSEIEEIIRSNPDKYSDLWEKPVIGEAQEEYFYFTPDGLVVFYPPYELSYYARGFVEFCFPYDSLFGYIKPTYSQ